MRGAYTSGAVSGYNPHRPVSRKGRDEVPACRRLAALVAAFLLCLPALALARETNGMMVLETDFGLKDGAVAAMKGVALGVDRGLVIHDLSHDIPPFDIWTGAYQLD